MVQVPDWSKDEFENRSGSLARLIRLAWRAIARAFAGRLESQVVATSADVAGLPAAWDMEVEAQILGYVTDTYLDAASKMRIELDASDDFIPTDDLVAAYLRTARNRLKNIGDDVWEVVSEQLIQGISAGESIPELAARVRNTAGVSDARSLTIARTEVHAAHEAGSYDQALFVDPTATKVWLATEDARTRPTHQAAEGQRRRINESFEVGGAALRYPGDPLGPADEVINCRCTTVYDFSTLDSVTSDDPELALVAASKKKWTPSKHPRGSDGKFIKKGAVADLLSKPKPELLTVSTAIDELTEKSWGQLTDAQQDYIMDSYGKLPKGSYLEKHATEKLSKIGVLKAAPAETPEAPAVPKAKVLAQAAPKSNKAAKTILEADDFAQLGNQKYKKPLGKTGKPLRVGFLGDDGSITAHVGSKPGDPAKVSTFLIWGKYPPGTTILESADGTDSVVWNGKKFDFRTNGQTTKTLGKQDTYDTLHSQTGWKVPKYEGQPVDQPGVLTELVEGYQEPDDEVDTDLPGPAPTPEPTSAPEPEPATSEVPEVSDVAPEPEPEPISAPESEPEPEPVSEPEPVTTPTAAQVPAGLGDELDFGGYQKIGGQGGSNPGGVFEAPDGTREYIKKAKSEQHAANEVAASAFYNLAGISTPQVRKGHGAPGIGGGLQTGTKLVPGAKSDLKSKMQDPEYKKEIQSGFVVDAWLANWDVAGLVYDNIVTGEDGKPYRIDVGGALLFRAQGAPKGGAFGPTVTELDTLRNASMNKQSASLFGDMTDEEIAQAAQRVTSITDEQIDQIVKDSGLPSKVAQILKDRRDYIADKYPAPAPAPVLTPEPEAVVEEPDVLQQLIDGTFTDAASVSLNKLKTSGEQLSNAESVQLAQGITQEEYNSLTKDQRLKLAAGVDASLDDPTIDNTDAWLAFNRLSDLVVYATPAPAPPTPAMQIPTPEPTVQLPPGASLIGEGLEDTHWSDLTQNAANGLYPAGSVVAQTADGQFKLVDSPSSAMGTWSLQDAEGNHLETFTDANVEAGYPEDYGSTPWHSVPPAPAVVEDDEDANELPHDSAWADLFDANAYPSQPVVIAESSPGNYRVVAQPNNTFSLEVNDGGVWIDIETFDPNVSEESFSEIAESHASGWHAITPVAVPATFPTPPAPAPTGATPALTLPDTTWTLSAGKSKAEIEAYTSFNHPAGTILGITPDANMQVVSVGDGSYVLQMLDADNNWFDGASVSAGVLASMLNENTWTLPDSTFDAAMPAAQPSVPAWKLVPAIDPPEGTVYEPVEGYLGVLDDYVNFDHPAGTVIALRNVNGVNVRIVKTGLDAPEYKTQLQSLSDGQWYDNNAGDVSAALVINQLQTNPWLLPQSALLPALGPKTTPVGPSSPDVTPASATSGADTSSIPTFYKKSWKKKLSAAKVGYYSKPEKIWDQVKEIQAQYPDPANPGQSKYTPLQIIKSLDDVYTGKKEQNPYETKMVAWAATSKGKAYTGNTGTSQAATPNTPAATQTAPPPDPQLMAWTPENTGKLFDAVQDMELGTVLATNIDTKGGQFQIVVGDQVGVKTPHLQYKPAGETAWQPSIFMPDKQGFIKGMDIDFGNGPWKSTVILLPNGGIQPAMAPSTASPMVTPTLEPTSANAALVWDKLTGVPDGTVVAFNQGGSTHQYRMVVEGINPLSTKVVWQQKSKADPDAPWTAVPLTATTEQQFAGFLTDLVGGSPWQLFDVGAPGVPAAAAPTPSGPKPFKATVKAIYAAMPTYQVNKPVATAEFNGEQYALIPGYGKTKGGYASSKKKLILKKKSPYGDYWMTVQPLDTQVKLGQILKDPKYAWVEAAETPAVPPPSVSAPVKASKPTVSVGVFKNTPEDIGNLWDSLNEIGDGVILADGTPNGVPTKIMSKIAPDGSVKVEAHTQTGTTPFASSKEDLVSKLNSDATWTITASKSPLFGAGEIANLSEDQQQGLYADFKKQPATYLKSPAQDIYAALSTIASDNGLTLLQMLRVVDAVGAKKVNKPDEHLFEKKIKDWLQTPQGAAVASGKPIPLPAGPALSPGVSLSGVPSFEESNQYSYKVISTTEATKLGNDFKKKSEAGDWTQAQHDGLQAYTGGIYYSINQYYYGKLPSISSTNEKAAKNAQLGMRPSTVPLLLHRGTGFDGVGGASSHADLLKMVGSTFFSGGFFSTSVGGSAAFGGKSVILEIEAPPGTPMAYLKNISLHKSENEMLLAAGLSYRIQEVRKEGSKSVVRVRVVPPDKPFPWETSVEG